MKSNSIDKNRKNIMNQVKVNIINNIPKRKPLNCFKNSKPKLIKYKTSNNHINAFKQFNNNNNNIIKDISKYISINKSLLLSAYEKSILILFESLKLYMKNDLKFFNEIKENFIKNVQDFYQKKKYNFSAIPNKTKEEIKIDNYINYKTSNNKNSRIKSKSNSNITYHKKNKTHFNNSMRKFFSGLSYNSINKSNASIKTSSINNKNKIINNAQKNHKNSLYSLIKSDKQYMSNSPIKEIDKNNYKFSILNNFIDLKQKNKINSSESTQNGFTIKSEKPNNGRDIYKNEEEEKNINENCSFNKNDVNNYITNIHNNIHNSNIHNNIYYNKIISQIPNKNNSEKYILSNDLITRIKNSLDENLKGIFDFSYESFLNKETEREGN